jgi:hypothetical protein
MLLYFVFLIDYVMTIDMLKTIRRHKQLIVLAVAAVAIASYIFPVDSMYGIAKAAAQSVKNNNNNNNNGNTFIAKNEAENRCSGSGTTCLAGAQQTLLFPGGIPTSTSFEFSNEAENRCSGGAFCQAQAIQYGFFGGNT